MAVELKIPSAGESITEVQIGQWLKNEGDPVERDEAVVEIETDKASMELPSPVSGILSKCLKQAGDVVPVGSVIALIDETARPVRPPEREAQAIAAAAGVSPGPQSLAGGAPIPPGGTPTLSAGAAVPPQEPRVMPAARRALAEARLFPAEVQATGPGGRLLKEDVQRHVAAGPSLPAVAGPGRGTLTGETPAPPSETPTPASAPAPPGGTPTPRTAAAPTPASSAADAGAPTLSAPLPARDREEQVVPMTMLRRRIAQRLVEAQQTMAMLTTFNEVDMSAVQRLRAERGADFEKKYEVRLGLMSFFVKAVIDALKSWPAVNAEIRGTDIVYKNYYDIGIAVSTEHGLVVPVVRDAERLSFAEVELAIGDLARRARERKITIEELQGGTFTITNGGVFGSLLATPIINPPQSAILGLHTIQERPVVRDGQVVIRPMMYVALTYDHRIIDGRESVSFLKRVKQCVEDPTRMLLEA